MAAAKKVGKDIQKYKKLLKKEKRLQYYLTLARLYESAEDLGSAEKLLDEAVANFPDLSSVKVALAHVLNESGRPKDAQDLLEPVIAKDRDNLLAARRLAESYELSGDLERALGTYRSILRFRLVGQEVKGQVERLERLVNMGQQKKAAGDSDFVGMPTLSL
ncbi:MAG: tetratricopeptide repeat protein, partial [Candidatus Coatesbacteria bacterium]|nr:tetratricopeptide repeat protein [Candidatus Coatesbacteria bacterium]